VRVGIFGGSFNPVHNGHLKLAQYALEELGLQAVYFVPSYQNPLEKKETLLPASLRVSLLKTALKKKPFFKLSLCELERKGPSFTVDTLRYFRKRLPKETVIYFLSGADQAKNFFQWKSWKKILKECRFVLMTRPGVGELKIKNEKLKIKSKRPNVLWIPFDAMPISSSEIRARLKKGLSIEGLVPEETLRELKAYYL
jgi:nicotinate-nucleotide adenylyltransferase